MNRKGGEGMQAEIDTWADLALWLQKAQQERRMHMSCRLSPVLTARCSASEMEAFLTLHLPLAQGYAHQLVRQRSSGGELRLHIRWRDGLRLLDAYKAGQTEKLSAADQSALRKAMEIVEAMRHADAATQIQAVYMALCRNLTYTNTVPGRVGYEALVGAVGALNGGCANCQGFSDAFFLIAGLAGLTVRHIIGRRGHALHMWNAVHTQQGWLYADVSRGARLLAAGEDPTATLMKTADEMREMGFSWDVEANLAVSS